MRASQMIDTKIFGIVGWSGSGKTSLMNRLWMELKGDDKNTEIECIWINTWEHSLLKSPEETLISIVFILKLD